MKDTKQTQADKAFTEAENDFVKRITLIEKELNCKLTYLSLRKISNTDSTTTYKTWREYEV